MKLLITLFITFAGQAQGQSENSFATLFQKGVQSYQTKDYPEAKKSFEEALALRPTSPQVLANLGHIEYQQGNKALAIGFWRKALYQSPGLISVQKALSLGLDELPVKEIPHKIQFSEEFRSKFLIPTPFPLAMGMTALLFFLFAWFLLSYLGEQKKSQEEERPHKKSILPPLIFGVLWILGFVLTLLKGWDLEVPRATVLVDEVSVKAGPTEKSPELFLLYSGLEVVIKGKKDSWMQVYYPGGYTGWVEKDTLFHHAGKLNGQ